MALTSREMGYTSSNHVFWKEEIQGFPKNVVRASETHLSRSQSRFTELEIFRENGNFPDAKGQHGEVFQGKRVRYCNFRLADLFWLVFGHGAAQADFRSEDPLPFIGDPLFAKISNFQMSKPPDSKMALTSREMGYTSSNHVFWKEEIQGFPKNVVRASETHLSRSQSRFTELEIFRENGNFPDAKGQHGEVFQGKRVRYCNFRLADLFWLVFGHGAAQADFRSEDPLPFIGDPLFAKISNFQMSKPPDSKMALTSREMGYTSSNYVFWKALNLLFPSHVVRAPKTHFPRSQSHFTVDQNFGFSSAKNLKIRIFA